MLIGKRFGIFGQFLSGTAVSEGNCLVFSEQLIRLHQCRVGSSFVEFGSLACGIFVKHKITLTIFDITIIRLPGYRLIFLILEQTLNPKITKLHVIDLLTDLAHPSHQLSVVVVQRVDDALVNLKQLVILVVKCDELLLVCLEKLSALGLQQLV